MSNSNTKELVKNYVMGVGLTNEREEDILEYIVKHLPHQQKPYYIVTPNPEMIVLANKDEKFKTILNNAQIALTDGMQLYRSAQVLGIPLKERIIGTDFVEKLCEKVADQPIAVGFLGGGPGVAEKAAECLRQKYSKLNIVFTESEWKETNSQLSSRAKSRDLSYGSSQSPVSEISPRTSFGRNDKSIDILFVAFGFPKQEKWMAEHVGKVPAKVMMGVGGALDQIVDPSLRPPVWVHSAGLGWLYRLIRQPWRIKRQAKLVEFLKLVQKEKATLR